MSVGEDELGFVVIGRNEGARLELCLQSVLAVSNNVVYADSASTDGSAELAERLGASVVRLPADGRLTAARGRNAGYKELRSRLPNCRFVQFLDGDCVLQPGWIDQSAQFLEEHPDVAVVCGRRFEAHPEASVYNAMCNREWDTPIGEARECGGDALIRCDAFEQVGGYRSELKAGEEPEMTGRMRAAGWKIWRIDALMTEHDAQILRLKQWWHRTQRGGYGYAQVWFTSRNSPRLYGRQLFSAFVWVIAVPVAVVAASLLTRQPLFLLALPLVYGAQLFRMALRDRAPERWWRAGLILLGKIPETIGACRFVFAPDADRVPDYKR